MARAEDVFLVRIRRDVATTPRLRGFVERATTGERFYFTTLGDLHVFMRARLDTPLPDEKA